MTLLQANALCLTLDTKKIFSDISFTINANDRIALVGRNGCGKTSLLRVLTQEMQTDSGTLTRKRGLVIGYAAQELPEAFQKTSCYDFLASVLPMHERDAAPWRVDIMLQDIGLPPEQWHQPLKAMSGGWRRLLLIAAAALPEPDLLILDEPTNHLDLGKIFRLQEWLSSMRTTLLIVSHDRDFIDHCTGKTFFMRGDGMHVFNAPYSVARQNLLEADLLAARRLKKEQAEIDRLEKVAARLHDWANRSNSTSMALRAKAVRQRAAKIEKNKTNAYQEQRGDIRLHAGRIRAQTVMTFEKSAISTDEDRLLFNMPSLQIRQGDRVALLGLNGAGKSVFIRKVIKTIVSGKNDPFITVSPQIKVGYIDQHLSHLPDKESLFDFISKSFGLDETEATQELTAIGFPAAQQTKTIERLSFGEKARLALLALRLQKPNVYILDEPTNHLDIPDQEMLEEEINRVEQTCLFVSHDRHLVRNTATRFWEIQRKRLVEIDDPDIFFDRVRSDVGNI